MRRTRARRSNRLSVNRFANSSRSGSLIAGLDTRKSSFGSTSPRPIRWNQTRFACAAAKIRVARVGDPVRERLKRIAVRGRAIVAKQPRGQRSLAVRGCLSPPSRAKKTTCSPSNSCLSNLSLRLVLDDPVIDSTEEARRTRGSRPGSSDRTDDCGTSRTACECRETPERSIRPERTARATSDRDWPAGFQ